MDPTATTGLVTKVGEQGPLAAFMLLCLISSLWAIKILYQQTRDQGKENVTALIDSTTAINNNTAALGLITKQMERLEKNAG